MILKNIGVFYGKNLRYINSTNLKINNHYFDNISKDYSNENNEPIIDCEGLVILPGFINSHTHIGDSIAKDINLDLTVNEKVNPIYGIKKQIINNSLHTHLESYMYSTCKSMIKKGITTFVDFREGGILGVTMLKKILRLVPIKCVILGRIDYYQTNEQIIKNRSIPKDKQEELRVVSNSVDGLGISGANEYSDSVLAYFSKINKFRAIHAAETEASIKKSKQLTGKSEIQRSLQIKPHFIIHMTYASKFDLHIVRKYTNNIVVCPRSNAAMAEKFPDVYSMLKLGYNISLGTDNVMINSPDIFREMDYLWKTVMSINNKRIAPLDILKMATVNAGKIFRNKGVIQKGSIADCIFIKKHEVDLDPMHDPHAAIVHRASESSISAVMINGKIIHGKI